MERVWIEKDDGGQRPIGKPTFEDKMVQRAVAMLLEAIDEQDFSDGSYGFRQGRSPHEALHELRQRCMTEGSGWIVDADVSGDFDSIDRTRLREVLRQRVNDGRMLRLIGKWLRAGVHGRRRADVIPRQASCKAASLHPCWQMSSSIMSWMHGLKREVQPRMQGRGFLIRFADDFVIGCEHESGRSQDDGRAAEAVCSLRADHASDEDGVDCVQETGGPPGSRPRERHMRLSRIDPLLDDDHAGGSG